MVRTRKVGDMMLFPGFAKALVHDPAIFMLFIVHLCMTSSTSHEVSPNKPPMFPRISIVESPKPAADLVVLTTFGKGAGGMAARSLTYSAPLGVRQHTSFATISPPATGRQPNGSHQAEGAAAQKPLLRIS